MAVAVSVAWLDPSRASALASRRRARCRRTRSARGPISSTRAASSLLRPSHARSSSSSRSLSLSLPSARPSRVSPAVGNGDTGVGWAPGRVHGEALAQRALTRASAALVGQHAAGDAEQPDPLLGARNLLQPAPGDQEDLGEHVVGVRAGGTPARVAQHRGGVAFIQRLETLLGRHRDVDVRLGRICYSPPAPPARPARPYPSSAGIDSASAARPAGASNGSAKYCASCVT